MRERFTMEWADGDYLYFDNEEIMTDEDILNMLNDLDNEKKKLESELSSKEHLIQQLKAVLNTDDRKQYLKYRKRFIEVCEELMCVNQDCRELKEELNAYKQRVSDLLNRKITDVEERKGYLFKSNEADAIVGVLNELKGELND